MQAASAVAKHELAKDNGTWGSARATAAAVNAVQFRCGRCTADGPKVTAPWNASTIATTANTTKNSVILRRRSSSAAVITATVAPPSRQIECRWSVNAFGVADTSFHASWQNSSPTDS